MTIFDERHLCPATDCTVRLQMHVFACTTHWRALPQIMRTDLQKAWRNVDSDMAHYLRIRGECVKYLQTHVHA